MFGWASIIGTIIELLLSFYITEKKLWNKYRPTGLHYVQIKTILVKHLGKCKNVKVKVKSNSVGINDWPRSLITFLCVTWKKNISYPFQASLLCRIGG